MKQASVIIRDLQMRPLFALDFYGLGVSDLASVSLDEQSGGEFVRAALRRRGLDPDNFMVSVFDVHESGCYVDLFPVWNEWR